MPIIPVPTSPGVLRQIKAQLEEVPPPSQPCLDDCSMCWELLHDINAPTVVVRTKHCQHMFHEECIMQWFLEAYQTTCPMCRA
jgi:hypothetical protein